MCGIVGLVGAPQPANIEAIGKLTSHRGPDNLGTYQSADAILIHNRLSIIDLSPAANQPMSDPEGRYQIIFNGEIYNYPSLKTELEGLGHSFKTHSDTEVLLTGYRQWGAGVLDRLDGMFAFAIWDTETKKLFCARDHIGIKPLFFRHDGNRFSFSSELKSLEKIFPGLAPSRSAIAEYLIFNYIPAPKTIFDDVFKLTPGHYLEYDLNRNTLDIKKWWDIPSYAPLEASYEEAKKLVRETVGKAVRSQMISDVPLGAFLSGGIDSSVIVAEMSQAVENAKVFSISYTNNSEYDEVQYAAIIAKKFGLDHHIIRPDFESMRVSDTVELILSHMDEPYGNPTVAMTNLLCKAAREEVVVALVGDGADEVFGGYPRYRALTLAQRTKPFMALFGPIALGLLSLMPETPSGNHKIRRLKKFIRSQQKSLGAMFQDWTSIGPIDQISPVLSSVGNEFMKDARTSYLADLFEQADAPGVSSACYADQKSFLPYNLLDGADRLSMAQSFELRVPFVNRELIELSSKLRPEWKINGSNTKRILKEAYSNLLPAEILNRPKRGFNPPVWHWLQNSRNFVHEILGQDSKVATLFHESYIPRLLEQFYAQKEDSSSHIWSLIVLETWLRARNINLS